ncbi:MAG: hypothetical protein OXI60_09870 [Acidiferrobacterales bacterium]|nr:hypothetical protein [Acidiferrobacterales bacterium]
MNIPNQVGRILCKLGLHKYRVVEIKFGFGTSGKVEIVECERCGYTTSRLAK